MKTSLICLAINLVCGAVFSIPTVAFLSEYDILGNDAAVVEVVEESEDLSIDVSEPLEPLEASAQVNVSKALVEPVGSLTEPVEGIVEGSDGADFVDPDLEVVIEPRFEHLKPKRHYGYFNVPLEHELQDHIFAVCEKYGIDPALVVAIIQKESMFDIDAIGDRGRAQGLMQVQERWHFDRIEELGVTDLLDPYQNVTVGISYLDELFDMGGSVEWVLMAYNGGPVYANKKVEAGVITEYVEVVMAAKEGLR